MTEKKYGQMTDNERRAAEARYLQLRQEKRLQTKFVEEIELPQERIDWLSTPTRNTELPSGTLGHTTRSVNANAKRR